MAWLIFAVVTASVAFFGPRLARVVQAIAERTEIGDVLVGAVLLGAVTSLPGLVFTIISANQGEADLAFTNAVGGVAAQTLFIAVADIAYRRGTLSAGVPTREVGLQGAVLTILLSIVVIGLAAPDAAVGRVHVASIALVVTYGIGLAASRGLGRRLRASDDDEAGDSPAAEGGRGGAQGKVGDIDAGTSLKRERDRSTAALWARFGLFAGVLFLAGLGLVYSGSRITTETGLSASSVGFVLTSLASSTPELVTAVAAARRGAIGLAAGDIIGGNVFDTLFVAAADIASSRPLLESVDPAAAGFVGLALLMTGFLLAGLMRQGPGRRQVDHESLAIAVLWIGTVVILIV